MPLNPLSNLKLSLPEIEGSENPGKSLSRDLSSVAASKLITARSAFLVSNKARSLLTSQLNAIKLLPL